MSASQTTADRPESRDEFRAGASPRVIATAVECILRLASRVFRRPDPAWFELDDHLLADVGRTRGAAAALAKASAAKQGRDRISWRHERALGVRSLRRPLTVQRLPIEDAAGYGVSSTFPMFLRSWMKW
jgi:hypothetical protein